MSRGNKELVVDFIAYKLSQRDYDWNQIEGVSEDRTELEEEMGSIPNGSPSWHASTSPVVNGATGHQSILEDHESSSGQLVKQTLREAGDEFELRYRRAFSDLTSQLHITPGTAYQSFEQVVNELFRDGVNWGRIVAFFSFGGALCVESVDKEMQVLVTRIVSWMATYLTDHLDPWIQENGGWVSIHQRAATWEASLGGAGCEREACIWHSNLLPGRGGGGGALLWLQKRSSHWLADSQEVPPFLFLCAR